MSGFFSRINSCVCPSWLAFSLNNSLRRCLHNPEKILGEFVKPGSTVIDIGCGPGFFSAPMAQMAGPSGTVIAVDLQRKMLDKLMANAGRASLAQRIRTVECRFDDIVVREKADFILTFWMVHEVKDRPGFFRQVADNLGPGSSYLLVEPKIHHEKGVSGDRP
jgi:2-polyprenyl-3-methyl-5-hydroxy-6-metoxy-1,4-benzoquinol methylase